MSTLKINVPELASELAHKELKSKYGETIQIYAEAGECSGDCLVACLCYTPEAQEIFNDLYDEYCSIIESAKA